MRASRVIRRNKEWRRFVYYSMYAWGVPLLLTLITLFFNRYHLLPPQWAPNVGGNICWFQSESRRRQFHKETRYHSHDSLPEDSWRAHFLFFLLPVGVHIITNAVLFVLTSIHCSRVKSEIHRMQCANDDDSQAIKRKFIADKAKFV